MLTRFASDTMLGKMVYTSEDRHKVKKYIDRCELWIISNNMQFSHEKWKIARKNQKCTHKIGSTHVDNGACEKYLGQQSPTFLVWQPSGLGKGNGFV